MAIQSSGAISLQDIHDEAGGTTNSTDQASINDSDIRGLIDKASGAAMAFDEWYGASASIPISTNEHIFFKGGSTYPYQKERAIFTSASKDTTVIGEIYNHSANQSNAVTSRIDLYRFSGTSFSGGKRLAWTSPEFNNTSYQQYQIFVDDDAIYFVLGFQAHIAASGISTTQKNNFYVAKYNNSFTQQWQKKYTESGSGLWVDETVTYTSGDTLTIGPNCTGVGTNSSIDDADYIYVAASPSCSIYKINKSDGAIADKIRFSRSSSYRHSNHSGTLGVHPRVVISHSSNNSSLLNCHFGHTGCVKINKSNLTVNGTKRYHNSHYNDGTAHYSNVFITGIRDDPSNGDYYPSATTFKFHLKNPEYFNLFARMSTSGTVTWRKYSEKANFDDVAFVCGVDNTYVYHDIMGNNNLDKGGIRRINKSNGTYPTTMNRVIRVRNDANTGYVTNGFFHTFGPNNVFVFKHTFDPDFHDGTNYENRQSYWNIIDGDASASDDLGFVHIATNNWAHAFASTTVSKNGYQWVAGSQTAPTNGNANTSSEPDWGIHSDANTGIAAANASFISTTTVGAVTFGGTASSNIITGTN